MANEKNLKKNSERTPSELREMTRKGGIKSGEARRNKKTMREALEMLMFDVEVDEAAKDKLRNAGIDEKDFNNQMLITMGLMKKAREGDVQAYNAICAMIGEKPADKIDLNGDIFSRVRVVRKHQEPDGFTANSEDDIPDD
jgi:hypothetical protein